jgi:hypothetical protein
MSTRVRLASVAALGVALVVSLAVVGSDATLLLAVALGLVGVIGSLAGRAVRRPSGSALAVGLLTLFIFVGCILLIVLNNGADDWIGL